MTQSQLVKEIIKLSSIAEELGCQPVQEELLSTANYLSEFIEESESYIDRIKFNNNLI
tara:strand:+ start:329 stop:502 length:174 start_codon:yes stop_codon:yes gene_type:complete